jgi:hypothetical protein
VIPRDKCKGCRDDFYNCRQNLDGSTRCWSAKDGKMVTRYRLHWWTAPTVPGAFEKVRVPSCYHQPGQYAYYEQLPSCARKLKRVV